MILGRTIALARKETIQIFRDPRSLAVVLIMPMMLMALMGYGINLDQAGVPLCTYDREGSQQSQDLLKRFTSNRYFALARNVWSYRELVDAIDSRQCTIGIVVPFNFSQRLREGDKVPIQAIVDATDDNTANLVIGYSQVIAGAYSESLVTDFVRRQGKTVNINPLAVNARTWFNEDLESRNFIVPGVVAIVMAVIGTFLTSLTIAREWERGTMEQLVSTPVHPMEVMAGKLAPYFAIGMADAALCVGIAVWWFEVPMRGSMIVLFAASGLFLAAVLLLGFLISVLAGSQLAASQFALILTFLPSFLLSGFTFPIDQMPVAVRAVTVLIPARYYIVILNGVFLKGSGFLSNDTQFLALLAFCTVMAALSARSFKKALP
jgi:drug efflux transport system permease protein